MNLKQKNYKIFEISFQTHLAHYGHYSIQAIKKTPQIKLIVSLVDASGTDRLKSE